WMGEVLADILDKGERYGARDLGKGRRVQVEFVSANPTGPLHVGHGRGAAVGDIIANILAFTGWSVEREYYINDAGLQMDILGRS
ncbi:MAG TPA: arginine--tRNA ligase, partial [Synergistaceae bacterium]|nr:arginine--tRNA ligase [Synergistaceae bacterium]